MVLYDKEELEGGLELTGDSFCIPQNVSSLTLLLYVLYVGFVPHFKLVLFLLLWGEKT